MKEDPAILLRLAAVSAQRVALHLEQGDHKSLGTSMERLSFATSRVLESHRPHALAYRLAVELKARAHRCVFPLPPYDGRDHLGQLRATIEKALAAADRVAP